MKYNEGTFKYMLKKIIGALASIIGGLLAFLCVYWLFRLDTWTERGGLYRHLYIFGSYSHKNTIIFQ